MVVEPAKPVPRWHLAPEGVARARAVADRLPGPDAVWSSTECKAIETAGLIAGRHGVPVRVHPGLDEIDRSATGYLPPGRFQHAADQFFAWPEQPFAGWERAVDAQARILAAWREIVAAPGTSACGSTVLVGHGGTGTLLWCALAGQPIDRRHDAPRQGCFWRCDPAHNTVSPGWETFEALTVPAGPER